MCLLPGNSWRNDMSAASDSCESLWVPVRAKWIASSRPRSVPTSYPWLWLAPSLSLDGSLLSTFLLDLRSFKTQLPYVTSFLTVSFCSTDPLSLHSLHLPSSFSNFWMAGAISALLSASRSSIKQPFFWASPQFVFL